ncbi:MAG: MarR family transcriptional regulator [Cytophagales bacterium]|nr:MAG: MarR family transcriptional regulator [Cytophagales bacterium]
MKKREESVDYQIKAAWHAIARMYNAESAKHDSTASVGYILINIDAENGTPATKIAPLLGLESRSITRTLKNMEQEGYIYRVQDEKDKRFFRIFLTEKGLEGREFSKKVIKRFNQMVKENLSDEQLKNFFETMQIIQKVVEQETSRLSLSENYIANN